jgi:hypothetical protein
LKPDATKRDHVATHYPHAAGRIGASRAELQNAERGETTRAAGRDQLGARSALAPQQRSQGDIACRRAEMGKRADNWRARLKRRRRPSGYLIDVKIRL